MSTSVSSVVNHFPSAENGFTTTTSGSVSSGATTVGLNSVAGYTNGETAVFVIDPTDATKKQTFTGVIDTSGVQVTGVIWTAGTNVAHASGATVVDYATATHISMISKGILVEHDQDGAHTTAAVTTMTSDILAAIMPTIYPVGSIYTNATVSTNPGTLLGFGTWTAFGSGRVLVGVDGAQTEFDTLGETGGAKTHTLITAEMPSHDHNVKATAGAAGGGGGLTVGGAETGNTMSNTGGGGSHNNLQPYIVVYMWKRTA